MTPSGRYNQIDLRYRAGSFALEFEGEWDASTAAIFGPSGAGKSTILEIIAGVRKGATGRVILEGRTILDTDRGVAPPARLRWVGWVPQDSSLFPHLTALENVRYGLRRGGAEGERRLAAAVEALEIGEILARRAPELSGGERQRVAVARAIASGARVLLLDEPLASLDVPLRSRVYPLFLRLRDELRIPILYVSHDADEVVAIAEHVLVAMAGRCVASGRAADVLADAARDGAFGIHAAENRFSVRLVESHPDEGTALIELPSGLRVYMAAAPPPSRGRFDVVVRGEEIILAVTPPGVLSAQNVLEGRIVSIEEREGKALVTVEASGSTWVARITRRALGVLGLRTGGRAYMVFKASSVRAITRTDPGRDTAAVLES